MDIWIALGIAICMTAFVVGVVNYKYFSQYVGTKRQKNLCLLSIVFGFTGLVYIFLRILGLFRA